MADDSHSGEELGQQNPSSTPSGTSGTADTADTAVPEVPAVSAVPASQDAKKNNNDKDGVKVTPLTKPKPTNPELDAHQQIEKNPYEMLMDSSEKRNQYMASVGRELRHEIGESLGIPEISNPAKEFATGAFQEAKTQVDKKFQSVKESLKSFFAQDSKSLDNTKGEPGIEMCNISKSNVQPTKPLESSNDNEPDPPKPQQ